MDYSNGSPEEYLLLPLSQNGHPLESYVEVFVEHVHWVSWSYSVLNHVLLNGLDDDLLITFMLLDVYKLSLVDFHNRVLEVMGSCVVEVDEDSRDVFTVPSCNVWIATSHPKPESSTFLVSASEFKMLCSRMLPRVNQEPDPKYSPELNQQPTHFRAQIGVHSLQSSIRSLALLCLHLSCPALLRILSP